MIASFLMQQQKKRNIDSPKSKDPSSPIFWQDRLKGKDEQIHKLNLLLNETEGKMRGYCEVS